MKSVLTLPLDTKIERLPVLLNENIVSFYNKLDANFHKVFTQYTKYSNILYLLNNQGQVKRETSVIKQFFDNCPQSDLTSQAKLKVNNKKASNNNVKVDNKKVNNNNGKVDNKKVNNNNGKVNNNKDTNNNTAVIKSTEQIDKIHNVTLNVDKDNLKEVKQTTSLRFNNPKKDDFQEVKQTTSLKFNNPKKDNPDLQSQTLNITSKKQKEKKKVSYAGNYLMKKKQNEQKKIIISKKRS